MESHWHILAQEESSLHREKVLTSESCGCFHCLTVFSPLEITNWADDGNTALCPYCFVDAVIGSSSGYPISRSFLARMERYWFDRRKYDN